MSEGFNQKLHDSACICGGRAVSMTIVAGIAPKKVSPLLLHPATFLRAGALRWQPKHRSAGAQLPDWPSHVLF